MVVLGANDDGTSHLGASDGRPYTCMSCDAALDVQYHCCPACGAYDVRRAKWVRE